MNPIPISALEHYAYCPRQCALIHVEGQWRENTHTERGHAGHNRVDNSPSRMERGRRVVRGLELWSEVHNLAGRADAVEVSPSEGVVPVEYKMGVKHGDAAEVQLCAQALCLEEMFGVTVTRGAVWYARPRQREEVLLCAKLRERTLFVLSCVAKQLDEAVLPPAADDERCAHCQLQEVCLPSVVARNLKVS